MNLDMNEVEVRHFGVLVRAIDTESKDLAIWTTQIPQKTYFVNIVFGFTPKTPKTSKTPIIPIIPMGPIIPM